MEFKEAMEVVGGLENSEEVIGAITGRIQKANQEDKDYKASLSEKDNEINSLKSAQSGFLESLGAKDFNSATEAFESLKKSGGESGEQALTIKKLTDKVNTLSENLTGMKTENEAKDKKILDGKKSIKIKDSLEKAGMISSSTIVKAYMSELNFDSEGVLVSKDGKEVSKYFENVLEEEPHLKKSGTRRGSSSFSASSNSKGNERQELENFLEKK